MNQPLRLKTDSNSETMSASFKSLKRSLKETLERLETIGINDSESGDELSMLRLSLSQKDKIIEDQASEIERLRKIVEISEFNAQYLERKSLSPELPTRNEDLIQLANKILTKLKEFPGFVSEINSRISSGAEFVKKINNKDHSKALSVALKALLDFLNFSNPNRLEPRPSSDYFGTRNYLNPNKSKASSKSSKASDLDQELSDQKKLLSNLCKEIAISLNPESLEGLSDYEDS